MLTTVAHAEPAPDSEEQLIIEAQALASDPATRPSHVQPALPGTFGERSESAWPLLEQSRLRAKESPADAELRRAVTAGEQPLGALPPRWKSELNAMRREVDQVRSATHAERGALPSYFSAATLFQESPPYAPVTAQQFAKLAALQVRMQIGEGNPAAALEECADALAVARDSARSSMVGQLISLGQLKILRPACEGAISAAPPEALRGFAHQVEVIQAGWTPIATTLQQEKIFCELNQWARLKEQTRAAVPPSMHLDLPRRASQGVTYSVRQALFGGWERRAQVASMNRMIAAAALPPAQADQEIEAAKADGSLAMSFAGDGDVNGLAGGWTVLVRRLRGGAALRKLIRLEALAYAFKAEHGHWPTSWAETGVVDAIDVRSGRPFLLSASADGARIFAQPDGPRTEETLEAQLHEAGAQRSQ